MIAKYNNIHDPTPIPISITDYINAVKNGTTKPAVLAYQNATKLNKQQRTELKNAIPCVTISDYNGKHSGYITIDFDTHIERNSLIADKYSYVVAKSVGGINNFCIVKIDGSKHTESFKALQDHYYNTYGALINQGCVEVDFKRFVSYDADIYTNDKATVFKPKALKPAKIKSYNVILNNMQFGELIRDVAKVGIDVAHINIFGNALANTYGEVGRADFNSIFKNDTAYNYYMRTCDGSITLGSLYHVCKELGFKFYEVEQVNSEIQSNVILPRISGTKLNLVVSFLKENYNLAYNMITMQIEDRNVIINDMPLILQDNDYNTMYLSFDEKNEGAKVSFDFLMKVLFSNYIYAYNPILEFFEQNKDYKRDGSTIQQLALSINSTTPNYEKFMKHWLIGMVSGWLVSRSSFIYVLTGEQNTGKTRFFRNLLPKKLQSMYAEAQIDGTTDDFILMTKKMIIMDDEYGGKSKKDTLKLKLISSKDTISVRVPYGRVSKDMRCICGLAGTSNLRGLINDSTGNRRVLPTECISFNNDIYDSIDKTALLMDCYDVFQSGWRWWLDAKDVELLNESTDEFQETNYEAELILAHFSVPKQLENGTEYLSNTDIKAYIELLSKQRITDTRKLGLELKRLGFKQESKRYGKVVVKNYHVKKIFFDAEFSKNEQPF
jgi:hypothetical protein